MNILAIDTATDVMGVALTKDGHLKGELLTNLQKNHSVRLMPSIHHVMEEVEMVPGDLTKIIVSKGPGSYTGVRIGLSTAKAMAWALEIPIVGVSSLEVLAYQGRHSNMLISPFIDARREAVFTGLYQFKEGEITSIVDDQYIKMTDWLDYLSEQKRRIMFVSPNISMYERTIQDTLNEFAYIDKSIYQLGRPSDLITLGKNKERDEIHILTPKYLRLAEAEANWLKQNKGRNTYG
ncbi:MAG TPA: tRNA (adenosine(37)-N6)-threonylcarbamoyltransferase complex dimerization subunit type 1 TsaB [Bacillota bacterium]|nr:tRNA (adenosine(37)-N6)-threonylcarbamoyltransferase complex dimerization subunit type 1 TsaB [Bacillota bacterium]